MLFRLRFDPIVNKQGDHNGPLVIETINDWRELQNIMANPNANPQMTDTAKAELDAIRSASEVLAQWEQYTIIEYVRSPVGPDRELQWVVQMMANDGPKVFGYDEVIEVAAQIRQFKEQHPEFDTRQDALLAMGQ